MQEATSSSLVQCDTCDEFFEHNAANYHNCSSCYHKSRTSVNPPTYHSNSTESEEEEEEEEEKEDLKQFLINTNKNVFGNETFRPHQLDIRHNKNHSEISQCMCRYADRCREISTICFTVCYKQRCDCHCLTAEIIDK